ncbi:pectate lyase superfamily protein-domain-containing protein [Aspergillus foveolatus]|uniref:pectate lyase superfamily protein-domain-containing protein n=1 Tax=Aspergillus foveolatus TaxID=210207 RepID=UPI003CCE1484
MDYGAKGDGVTDDTFAINKAISDGGRCGANCGSSTIYPAVVYFPPGTYLVSSSIIQYYNTQLLGDPVTESPYYQPVPKAPRPFSTGLFKDDPTFDDCPADSITCALSWGVRIIDSKTVYVLGAGLDAWVYNLCTNAIIEMVSPVSELVTHAADNRNGFLSSILAWVRNSSDTTVGERYFERFRVYSPGNRKIEKLTETCQTALTQTIKCHSKLQGWQQPEMCTSLESKELTDEVCDSGCGRSLQSYYNGIVAACQEQNFTVAAGTTFPEYAGAQYGPDIIDIFTPTETYEEMPKDELCSPCYVNLHRTIQSSPYSIYHVATESEYLQARLEYIYSQCPVESGSTSIKDPQYIPVEEDTVPCFTEVTYTTNANSDKIYNCTDLLPDKEFCIPMTCDTLYILQDTDTCQTIELDNGIGLDSLRAYNPWINWLCDNLQSTAWMRGRTLCLSPQGGFYNVTDPIPGVIVAPGGSTARWKYRLYHDRHAAAC